VPADRLWRIDPIFTPSRFGTGSTVVGLWRESAAISVSVQSCAINAYEPKKGKYPMLITKKLALVASILAGCALSSVSLADGESNRLINNSYQQTAEISCAGVQDTCVVQFPPMTDTKTVITAVSCSVFVTPGSFVGFVLSDFGTTNSIFVPAFVSVQSTSLQAATNATVNLYFNKGETAAVLANVSNGGQFAAPNVFGCTISGYHS
jgi:hypothetical protein